MTSSSVVEEYSKGRVEKPCTPTHVDSTHVRAGDAKQNERTGGRRSKWADSEAYPEWSHEIISALPLARAQRTGEKCKLGKGKQVSAFDQHIHASRCLRLINTFMQAGVCV